MAKINIIYNENGSGLSKDAKIIKSILKKHELNNIDFNKESNFKKADINIFIQSFGFKGPLIMDLAKTNIIIPNQEWLTVTDLELLKQCQLVVCKTQYCHKLLENYNKNRIFTGFISEDLFFPSIKSDKILHFKGKSCQKNTECLIDNDKVVIYDPTKEFVNSNTVNYYLPESEKAYVFNRYGYHACPSLNEGWGHYVYEALSCGATPILTDAPFFDEIPRDIAIFIPSLKRIDDLYLFSSEQQKLKFPLRESYFVRKDHIEIIMGLLGSPKFNKESRNFFLESNNSALVNLRKLFN